MRTGRQFEMKKSVYRILTILLCLFTKIGYATPNTENQEIMISQVDAVDYVIFMGIGVFLIGMLLILLSMYSGGKNKAEVEEEYSMEEELEEPEEEVLAEPEEEAVQAEEPVEEMPEEPAEIIAEEPDPASIPEKVQEEAEEVEEEEVEEEEVEEEKAKVRITLTGVNNSDVKIAEFSREATVGRRGVNDIIIADNAVSGCHCVFTYEDGAVLVKDLESTNGTIINGEVIDKEEIKSGDYIVLGKHKYKINISL